MNGLAPKISIVIPVYNVEKYLSACLSSCVNQTLYDIEIICVNDGSPDNSLDILQAFAAKDHRIRIVNKENGGLSSARNAGIRVSTGNIIMLLDSDDYLSFNACERVWEESLEYKPDVIIFGTEIFPEYPRATNWYYNTLRIHSHRYSEFTPAVLFDEPGAKPFVWRHAYTRNFYEKTGLLFDERVKYGEDMVFQMEAFPHCARFSFISDALYHYRWTREGSLMDSYRLDGDKKVREHLRFCELITAYWREQGWLEQWGTEYTKWLVRFIGFGITAPEASEKAQLAQELMNFINKHGLEKHLNKIDNSSKRLMNQIRNYAT